MIGGLGSVFDLAQPFVDIGSCFTDGFCEKLRIHKMGAGAGGKVSSVFYQLHASDIDFTIAFYCILMELLDLVKAGGSRTTTSKRSPLCSNCGRRSNTSAHWK